MHHVLEPIVKKELNKLLATKIIFLMRCTKWVANMVLVRKKNVDIHLCIDFCNLNKASAKDNYLIPPMEQILQSILGSAMLSLLDGFSGYNHVLVSHPDQLKTYFRSKWETYPYRKMLFSLVNVGTTFQRAKDITFQGLIIREVIVYLDDVIVYSKDGDDHFTLLKYIFERCKKCGISLNPKKSTFAIIEGKLLGFVVSKEGMFIDLERTKAIAKPTQPSSIKMMQSFLGKINFHQALRPNFHINSKSPTRYD